MINEIPCAHKWMSLHKNVDRIRITNGYKKPLTDEEFMIFMNQDRPSCTVASELRIGITRLKKLCRKNGIKRWNSRKLNSFKYMMLSSKEVVPQEIPKYQRKLVAQMESDIKEAVTFLKFEI